MVRGNSIIIKIEERNFEKIVPYGTASTYMISEMGCIASSEKIPGGCFEVFIAGGKYFNQDVNDSILWPEAKSNRCISENTLKRVKDIADDIIIESENGNEIKTKRPDPSRLSEYVEVTINESERLFVKKDNALLGELISLIKIEKCLTALCDMRPDARKIPISIPEA